MRVEEIIKKKVKYNYLVSGISTDSRKVKKNDIFICLKGSKHNGEDYIDEVLEKKVKTIVTNNKEIIKKYEKEKINIIYTQDEKKSLAMYAKNFYNDISKRICLIGVTGTNGKTTTTTLLYKYYRYLGKNVCLIGTNGIYINDNYYSCPNTTPDILITYETIKKAIECDCALVIMEVSSIGIKEGRVLGLDFDITLFTNISHDHLDYHKDFTDYLYTKMFFLNQGKLIICNSDDEYFALINRMIGLDKKIITFGKNDKENIDFEMKNIEVGFEMSNFDLKVIDQTFHISTSLLGEYNIYNVTAFISIVENLDSFNKYTLSFLNKRIVIDGRFEKVETKRGMFIIDFAHTPDGITKVLDLINTLRNGKLIVVMGMGGDRDRSKRPIVGKILSEKADMIILTSDNSRFENVSEIINDITKGIENKEYIIEENREKAIEKAYILSNSGDVIALLGKGNEEYILSNGKLIPFKDKEEVIKISNKLGVIL